MDIGKAAVQANISSQRELWGLVKARRLCLQERAEAQAFVEERLGSVLLGQDLSPTEQAEYVRRLSGTAEAAQQLQRGPQVPDLKAARIPRELLLFKAGGLTWRPFRVTEKQVAVTPLHRRLQDRMALALKNKNASSPESVRSCVRSISITIDRGSFQTAWNDEDRVELSGWGLQTLTLEQKMKEAPTLPAPRFLFATIAPTSPDSIAALSQ